MKRGYLRVKYKITGKKVGILPSFLSERGVSVFGYNQINEESCTLIIDFCDTNKFFAICKNMCYNKTIIGFYGVFAPLAYLASNIGIVLGLVIFCLSAWYLNGFILDIECTGTGACFATQTRIVAEDNGASKFARFNSVDFDLLESKILSSNPKLSFVSVEKQGNRLVINSVLSDKDPTVLGENSSDLISPYNGIIESLVVLRGTPLVKVGDVVSENTVIVGAYLKGKEDKTYPTYVIATATIIENKTRFIKIDGEITDSLILSAKKVAEFESDGEVIQTDAEKTLNGIIITIKIRHTINAVI